ncbi:hypothetical protein HQ36_02035 [Porphyromonas gingivicanis]|uniref:DUF2800 domain-containing protein n=1 Tax=Porphyromonas gingivicanis TaxID=266762 RepID=A0A0A2G5D0_9PORP|nr:DUF2800 domain-containing protein [Porphyromonas gingivicanis]KGN98416.1 hypothetical protein HQ36_02035 [Porphyromonas gingivicanis]
MGSAHALLSPSAAHRWINCTAAPRLEADVPDKGSEFAAEGTLAHAYCALKLKEFLGLATEGEAKEIAELNDRYHTGEMDEYTDVYKTIVLEKFTEARALTKDAQLLVETRLDFSDHIPDAFGTADAIIIADGTMEVIDFKYGKGVKVSAVDNPQMKIYALGAYEKFSFEYKIERVRMTIIQPRIDNLSDSEMNVADLLAWTDEILTPKARQAYKGDGPQVPGGWCQFCKVKSACRALATLCTEVVQMSSDPKLLSPEELATNVLPLLPTVKTWLSSVEDYALQQALSGVSLPGWKVVEGRSIRKITDQTAVANALTAEGYTLEDVCKPMELRTITDLEKLVGKKQFAGLCGDFVEKPQGKPTLVPENDKRPAFSPLVDDFKDINL